METTLTYKGVAFPVAKTTDDLSGTILVEGNITCESPPFRRESKKPTYKPRKVKKALPPNERFLNYVAHMMNHAAARGHAKRTARTSPVTHDQAPPSVSGA